MSQINAPEKEQEICISCGICCDGTLFDRAILLEGEKGSLPPLMEENYFKTEHEENFHLPCPYFSGKCSIYHQKKAHVCSAFRCKLLTEFKQNKLTLAEATAIVKQVKKYRAEIFNLAGEILKVKKDTSFRKMQLQLAESKTNENVKNSLLDLLIARCHIFDVLLIKHFKSSKEFEVMITNSLMKNTLIGM